MEGEDGRRGREGGSREREGKEKVRLVKEVQFNPLPTRTTLVFLAAST